MGSSATISESWSIICMNGSLNGSGMTLPIIRKTAAGSMSATRSSGNIKSTSPLASAVKLLLILSSPSSSSPALMPLSIRRQNVCSSAMGAWSVSGPFDNVVSATVCNSLAKKIVRNTSHATPSFSFIKSFTTGTDGMRATAPLKSCFRTFSTMGSSATNSATFRACSKAWPKGSGNIFAISFRIPRGSSIPERRSSGNLKLRAASSPRSSKDLLMRDRPAHRSSAVMSFAFLENDCKSTKGPREASGSVAMIPRITVWTSGIPKIECAT